MKTAPLSPRAKLAKQPKARAAAPLDRYAQIHRDFSWHVPEHFNMAQVCSRRWAQAKDAHKRVAVIADGTGLKPTQHTYAELQAQANQLSHALVQLGVKRGDRVAIVLPQRFETAVAYMAVLQMGAVAMPLSILFGPEALSYRLQDSQAVLAIADDNSLDVLRTLRHECPTVRHTVAVGNMPVDTTSKPAGKGGQPLPWVQLLASQPTHFELVNTLAEEPAVLIYTSGTTGNPKGALIPHRALIGNLTGFTASQNWFGFDPFKHKALKGYAQLPLASTAVFWSPADWAWTGGLMDALLPTLYYGRPIVAFNGRFSPQTAFELIERHGVTHTFLFPTALKAMMKAYPAPRQQFKFNLQAIMSAGEAVGDAVFAYCQEQLGVTVNEMFGQTEINYIVGNCARLWPARAGSMGKGYPGHRVAVIDEQGRECAAGEVGDVAVHRLDVHGTPDPIFFLGYWNNAKSTAAKYTGDWCRTGDLAFADADGYLWYQGRADDVFKAAGYRIGPGEIENCLVKHAAVANAAVVPKPDAQRGAVVKAYVVLAPDFVAHNPVFALPGGQLDAEKLTADLQLHVKGKLAPYEYPKEIEFVDALPMTTTGKVQRRVLRLQEEARAAQAAAS
jgi:acetyl-CoA synthetase